MPIRYTANDESVLKGWVSKAFTIPHYTIYLTKSMALMEQFLFVQQGVVIARCRVQYGKYFAIY